MHVHPRYIRFQKSCPNIDSVLYIYKMTFITQVCTLYEAQSSRYRKQILSEIVDVLMATYTYQGIQQPSLWLKESGVLSIRSKWTTVLLCSVWPCAQTKQLHYYVHKFFWPKETWPYLVLYNYHHSTKLYWKTSRVRCRLYYYECAARVTMSTATNE